MVVWQRKQASDKTESTEPDSALPDAFKAFYIIIFSTTAHAETVSWIIDLITRSQQLGGAELLVKVTKTETEVCIYFLFNALIILFA